MDIERLRRILGTPDTAWLLDRLARRVEQGKPLTGTVTLSEASTAQRSAAARLIGRPLRPGVSVSVSLAVLEANLRTAGLASDLRAAVQALTGATDKRIMQAVEDSTRESLLSVLAASRHAGSDWYDAWCAEIYGDGTLTRLMRREHTGDVAHAVAILDRLPAEDVVPLPVLAEAATGDTKALSGTPLERLVLRALAARSDQAVPQSRKACRDIWFTMGVVMDDMASQVLVLGVRAAQRHLVGDWLGSAAAAGMPFRLTLQQLLAHPVTIAGDVVYVCENPAVLRVASTRVGSDCPPLICTEGQPSVACDALLRPAGGRGPHIRWRGDFDWTGVRTTARAIDEYGADPWRMTTRDYTEALAEGDTESLVGTAAPTPWEPALHDAMLAKGAAVMEERIIAGLLDDLAGG